MLACVFSGEDNKYVHEVAFDKLGYIVDPPPPCRTLPHFNGMHILRMTGIRRVYGQFCIETLHESRKRKSSGLFV